MSLATAQDADVTEGGVFGQTMGLVAATLGFLTLGAYLGRHLSGGPSIVCFILGFLCLIGLNSARGASGAALGLLFAMGLFLGLGLGGGLAAYASADPGVVWQSAGATALFVGGLGALGYAVQSDLSGGYRVLFLLLLALIAYGLVTLFVSIPAGNVIYAVLGLGIFGGYVVLDFNRLRRADGGDAPSIAAGIFLDILNVFTFFLQLFGRGQN
ncbi:MAG: Bax inhibitor-1 family protein [Solirubrobacteraceae bacterium]